MIKLAVVGGGASGLMAALVAAREGARVTIFEKNDRIGKKLLMTGNGKCNFTNLDFSTDFFQSDTCTDKCLYFEQFNEKDTVAFFGELGMLIKNKGGYLYPASEQASTVLDLLRYSCQKADIRIRTGCEITQLEASFSKILLNIKETVLTENERGSRTEHYHVIKENFDRVILACGSKAGPSKITSESGYHLAKELGHTVIEPLPSLVQLRCEESFLKQLAGVRTDCELTLLIDSKEQKRERGELQLTDYGISGIPVFQFSRFAAKALKQKKRVQAVLNFLPDFTVETYRAFIHNRFQQKKFETAEVFFLGITNKKIILLLIKLAGLKPEEEISDKNRIKWEKVFFLLRELTVTVTNTNPMENAQAAAGGVSFSEVGETLESNLVSGIFFAGELLDMDGRCGGYNLQWAWTSGYIAGKAAAGAAKKDLRPVAAVPEGRSI